MTSVYIKIESSVSYYRQIYALPSAIFVLNTRNFTLECINSLKPMSISFESFTSLPRGLQFFHTTVAYFKYLFLECLNDVLGYLTKRINKH